MKNRSAVSGPKSLLYTKAYRQLAGSVTATILFQRLEFWLSKMPDGIYKFLEPSPTHNRYTRGDSWTEELGFSKDEFRSAFDAFGIRYICYNAYAAKENPFRRKDGSEALYCSYYDRTEGLTFYFRNHPLVDEKLEQIHRGAYGQSQHGHVGNGNMVGNKNEPDHIDNANMVGEDNEPPDHVGNADMLKGQNHPDHIGNGNMAYGQSQHGHVGHANFHHVNHDLNPTDQTRTAGARANSQSEFSLAVCREFAAWLQASGKGIKEPHAFGKVIWLSGEDDERIRQWQQQQQQAATSPAPGAEIEMPGEADPQLRQRFLDQVQLRVNPEPYQRYFAALQISRGEAVIYIRGSTAQRTYIEGRYGEILEEVLMELELTDWQIRFV